jgi:hypothetical protein
MFAICIQKFGIFATHVHVGFPFFENQKPGHVIEFWWGRGLEEKIVNLSLNE